MFVLWLTFVQEATTAVINVLSEAIGGDEGSKGSEAGGEEDGELDHFYSGEFRLRLKG